MIGTGDTAVTETQVVMCVAMEFIVHQGRWSQQTKRQRNKIAVSVLKGINKVVLWRMKGHLFYTGQ